jgi:hypothetical protein
MKSRFVDSFGRGGGEGSDKFDHKFHNFEQPNVANNFDRETSICPRMVFRP